VKNTNIRLVSGEAKSRLLEEHSPARLHLAKLISTRLSIEDKLRSPKPARSCRRLLTPSVMPLPR
jgi:hypothetical protein